MIELIDKNNEILRKNIKPINKFDKELVDIIDEILQYLNNYEGKVYAMAANQINIEKRIIFVYMNNKFIPIVNPEIIDSSGSQRFSEACASVKYDDIYQVRGFVDRKAYVKVIGYDKYGKEILIETDGLLATILQHEIDHLNGILYTDKNRLIGNLYKLYNKEEKEKFLEKNPLKIIKKPLKKHINRLSKLNKIDIIHKLT